MSLYAVVLVLEHDVCGLFEQQAPHRWKSPNGDLLCAKAVQVLDKLPADPNQEILVWVSELLSPVAWHRIVILEEIVCPHADHVKGLIDPFARFLMNSVDANLRILDNIIERT
ncbi:hypothetical protein MLD38_030499 [Melastoma candidum]|uniref:Uncharacterized protein n=1 Tax=Melastoma candidum TaxID=119954 RepID=A0ACB9MLX4_9MYRT|nr:hypothetical protein MLD38_030499 [Melastoma candidum]